MPTSRTLAALLVSALFGIGCSASAGTSSGVSEGELGTEVTGAGIAEGSLEAEGVLLLVNDRATTADKMNGVSPSVASSIVSYRTSGGAQHWFSTLDDVDALPGTDVGVFQQLLTDARAAQYVELPGFDAPDQAQIEIPSDVILTPSQGTVTVNAGFDGMSTDQVISIVRGRVTNDIASSNERFVHQTIQFTHRTFTIVLNNLFASDAPYASFLNSLDADRITLLGTMSSVHPTLLLAEKNGVATYYMNEGSGYQVMDYPHYHYPIIMRSRVRLGKDPEGPGVRLFYPAWSAKVLAGPTGTVTEGP